MWAPGKKSSEEIVKSEHSQTYQEIYHHQSFGATLTECRHPCGGQEAYLAQLNGVEGKVLETGRSRQTGVTDWRQMHHVDGRKQEVRSRPLPHLSS